MRQDHYTDEEVVRRGEGLYRDQIASKVGDTEQGKFLALDIETGTYEIDADELMALSRAKSKNPDAVLYMLRIGRPVTYRLGRSGSRGRA